MTSPRLDATASAPASVPPLSLTTLGAAPFAAAAAAGADSDLSASAGAAAAGSASHRSADSDEAGAGAAGAGAAGAGAAGAGITLGGESNARKFGKDALSLVTKAAIAAGFGAAGAFALGASPLAGAIVIAATATGVRGINFCGRQIDFVKRTPVSFLLNVIASVAAAALVALKVAPYFAISTAKLAAFIATVGVPASFVAVGVIGVIALTILVANLTGDLTVKAVRG